MPEQDATRNHYDFLAGIWDEMYATSVPYSAAYLFMEKVREDLGLENSVLDVACGTGLLLEQFENAGYQTYGVDLSEGMVTHARGRLRKSFVMHGDYHRLTLNAKVAMIVSFFNSFAYCLEIPDLSQVLTHLQGFLKPGGVIIFDIHTTEQPEEIFEVKSITSEKHYISRTFWGKPLQGKYRSRMVFAVFDRQTEERHLFESETTRGIFSHDAVLQAISAAGLTLIPRPQGYSHETFVTQWRD